MRPDTDRPTGPRGSSVAGVLSGGGERESNRSRTRALIALLADDSPATFAQVRSRLLESGKKAVPLLRRTARGGAPLARARARQILLDRERRLAVRRIARYASRDRHDLERALLLLESHRSPRTDVRPWVRALDAMGDALARKIRGLPAGRERVLALLEYLGGEIGFQGASEDYHHPDNIHLSRAIERRAGMPLTLAAIYSFVARRAGMQAGLLPFPGHVLLAVVEDGRETLVDPFGGGLVKRSACRKYLARNGFPDRDEWFTVASDTAMFLRHVLNLIRSCRISGRLGDARELESILRILADHPLQALGTR